MPKSDAIPTLTPDLELDRFDGYPEEVLECEWNPVLEQVLRLRGRRPAPRDPQRLYAEITELPMHFDRP